MSESINEGEEAYKEHTQVYGKPEPVLLPCPFCGGEAISCELPVRGAWNIGCSNLNCPIDVEVVMKGKDKAIAAWNKRAKP